MGRDEDGGGDTAKMEMEWWRSAKVVVEAEPKLRHGTNGSERKLCKYPERMVTASHDPNGMQARSGVLD